MASSSERLRDNKGRFVAKATQETLEKLKEEVGDDSDLVPALEQLHIEIENAQQRIDSLEADANATQAAIRQEAFKREYTTEQLKEERDKFKKQADLKTAELKAIQTLKDAQFIEEDGDIDVKVAKPKPFNGDSNQVERFLIECQLVFESSTTKYATLKSKLIYLLSYCTEGIASDWREHVLKDMNHFMLEASRISQEHELTPWDGLVEAFKRRWKSTTAKVEAQTKLQRIKQENDSVENYNLRFLMLSKEAEVGAEAQTLFYKRGLKAPIKQRIYDSGNIPTSLEEWQRRAVIIDTAWRESLLERQGSLPPKGKVRVFQGLDSLSKQPRLPEEEYQRRRKEGLCFKCGNKGHLANKCFAKGRRIKEEEVTSEEPTDKQDFI